MCEPTPPDCPGSFTMPGAAFYVSVRDSLFYGSLPSWQRDPLDRILAAGVARRRSMQEAAYVLASAYHETGRFRWMEEIGRGEGRDYGEDVLLIRGKRERFAGRGFIHLTWLANYARMSLILGVDLVNNPEKAAEPETAAAILWEGMIRGTFTGRNLVDYIRPGHVDYEGAREIVNGRDKAAQIAGYARKFEAALREGGA